MSAQVPAFPPLDAALFQAVPLPCAIVAEGILQASNQAFVESFPDAAVGTRFEACFPGFKGLPPVPHAIPQINPLRRGVRVSEPGAAGRTFIIRAQPLQPTGATILATFEDISERERLATELKVRIDALQRSNTDLEQFAYVASHDLQEPLRMMGSYAQILANLHGKDLDAESSECIAYIVDGATRMRQLVNDLLDYARVGPAGGPMRPVPAGQAFDKARAILAHVIDETNATVTCGSLPVVLADEPQLVQVFHNLLSNALKFRGPDAAAVSVEARRSGAMWEFCISDNGIGIDPKYFHKLFALFQRLHPRDEFPGTGIGLALCKKIVELHGGRIWVSSAAGRGTTLHFTLPGAVAA